MTKPTIDNAVRATVFAWGEDRVGITYEFADGRREAQAVDADDWLVMTRLERYGALTYRDDNAKRLADKLRALRHASLNGGHRPNKDRTTAGG